MTAFWDLRNAYLQRVSYQTSSKVPYTTAVKRLGLQFIREIWPSIRDATQADVSYCYNHRHCCQAGRQTMCDGSHLKGHVAGVTCVDFSGLGSQLGWLGKSALAFMAWLADQLDQKVDFIIAECVMNFDDAMLGELAGPEYALSTFTLSPDQFGSPSTRLRKYMVLLRVQTLRWKFMEDPVAMFAKLFHRPVAMTGEAFWNAPQAYVDKFHRVWAKEKHMPELQLNDQPWPSKLLMTDKTRQRVREWEQLLSWIIFDGKRYVYVCAYHVAAGFGIMLCMDEWWQCRPLLSEVVLSLFSAIHFTCSWPILMPPQGLSCRHGFVLTQLQKHFTSSDECHPGSAEQSTNYAVMRWGHGS